MKSSRLTRSTPLARTTRPRPRRAISQCTPEQRAKIREMDCVVGAGCAGPIDPAHLVPKGLCSDQQDDPRAVIPICRTHHRMYDSGDLDLSPYTSRFREELAFAVLRFDLFPTLRRVTNARWRKEEAA